MAWRRKRFCLLFMVLLLWNNASGLGVWNGRSAQYWQSFDMQAPGDQPLQFVQQASGVAATGVQSPEVGATNTGSPSNLNTRLVGLSQSVQGVSTNSDSLSSGGWSAVSSPVSAQSPSSSGSGQAVGIAQGLAGQFVSRQYVSSPQPQDAMPAQSTSPLNYATSLTLSPSSLVPVRPQSPTNIVVPGVQTQQFSTPVSPSQSSASESLASQQGSFGLLSGSPNPYASVRQSFQASSPQSLPTQNIPGFQASRATAPVQSLASNPASQQSGYDVQSSWLASQGQGTQSASQPSQNAPLVFQTQSSKPLPQASWDSANQYTATSMGQGAQPIGSSSLFTSPGRQSVLSPSQSQSTQSQYAPGSLTQPVSPSQTASGSALGGYVAPSAGVSDGSSSWSTFSQGQSLQSSTRSDVQNQLLSKPVLPYASPSQAGPDPSGRARWYKVDLSQFPAWQSNKPLSPSQSLGSQSNQAAQSSYPSTSQSSYPSTSQSQNTLGIWGVAPQSQDAPSSTVTLTQPGVQSPTFQTTSTRFSTSQTVVGPAASASQLPQRAQTSVTWRAPSAASSLSQTSPGSAASVTTSQQLPSSALLPQAASPGQTSGSYRPVLQSSAPLERRYSPVSNLPASLSAQATSGTFGLQSQSSQALGAPGQQSSPVGAPLNQPTSPQGPSSGFTAAFSPSSYAALGSPSQQSSAVGAPLNQPTSPQGPSSGFMAAFSPSSYAALGAPSQQSSAVGVPLNQPTSPQGPSSVFTAAFSPSSYAALGAPSQQSSAVGVPLNQPTSPQGPSSVFTAAFSPSAYGASESSSSSSYGFSLGLSEPYVYKPAPQRSPDLYNSVKH